MVCFWKAVRFEMVASSTELRKVRLLSKVSILWGLILIGCTPPTIVETSLEGVDLSVPVEHKNVLVILVDDLGYTDIEPYNSETFYETPHLKKFSRSATRFTDGYAASPVCSPSRYGLMTGRSPSRTDATDYFKNYPKRAKVKIPHRNHMPLEEVTMAESMKDAGYVTFFAGKWHLGPEEFWPEMQGFDINKGGTSHGLPATGKKFFSPYNNPRLKDGPRGELLPIRLANETNAFMSANRNRPFLAYLSFYTVHTPIMEKKDLIQKYQNKGKDEEIAFETINVGRNSAEVRNGQNNPAYAAMVERMDEAVGMVLDHLEALGLAENTAVFFTSDNGGVSTNYLGSEKAITTNTPLKAGKGWLYEGGIRVPFMMRVPKVSNPGEVNQVPVSGLDIYPTIMDWIGADYDDSNLDGKSLLNSAKVSSDYDPGRDRPLFWHYPHVSPQGGPPGAAIRRGNWKLIEYFTDGHIELFDLSNDLSESVDLSEENPKVVEALRSRLHDWYREVDAKFYSGSDGKLLWRPEAPN